MTLKATLEGLFARLGAVEEKLGAAHEPVTASDGVCEEKTAAEFASRMEHVESLCNAVSAENDKLRGDLSELQSQVETLEAENASLEERVNASNEEAARAKSTLSEIADPTPDEEPEPTNTISAVTYQDYINATDPLTKARLWRDHKDSIISTAA